MAAETRWAWLQRLSAASAGLSESVPALAAMHHWAPEPKRSAASMRSRLAAVPADLAVALATSTKQRPRETAQLSRLAMER